MVCNTGGCARFVTVVITCILTPFPLEFKLELLKKNNIPFLTNSWSGENDLEKFENWMAEILSWISGNGWKGLQFNVNALCHALDGEPKEMVLLDVHCRWDIILMLSPPLRREFRPQKSVFHHKPPLLSFIPFLPPKGGSHSLRKYHN